MVFPEWKTEIHEIYVIDGIPADEFYEQNADPITFLQNEDYEVLQKMGY